MWLAADRADSAARRLVQAASAERDAEGRLGMLEQLHSEYGQRMNTELARGTPLHGWQNFTQFMQKVDLAVSGQAQLLSESQARHQHALQSWQQERQRQLCYETLAIRAAQRERARELRREQKAMDEFAAKAVAASGGRSDR